MNEKYKNQMLKMKILNYKQVKNKSMAENETTEETLGGWWKVPCER